MTELVSYVSLFFLSFMAATVLPMQSEAALVGFLLTGDYTPWLLVAVASFGNVLGSCVNWALGREIETFRDRKWFPVGTAALDRAKKWYDRYGRWSLFLSWVPVIGDPLTVAAGVMREKLSVFVAIVLVAKAGRYIVLALVTLKVL